MSGSVTCLRDAVGMLKVAQRQCSARGTAEAPFSPLSSCLLFSHSFASLPLNPPVWGVQMLVLQTLSPCGSVVKCEAQGQQGLGCMPGFQEQMAQDMGLPDIFLANELTHLAFGKKSLSRVRDLWEPHSTGI